VDLGHTVCVDVKGTEKKYTILGSSQTDPSKGIISHNSPIGLALLGKKVGDEIHVELGGKGVVYRILSID
jgi:transcription elongation factor GreA